MSQILSFVKECLLELKLHFAVTQCGNSYCALLQSPYPNIRDFRGVSSKLDGLGNYTLGIVDHSIFPEINVERQRTNTGLDISIVTTAESDEHGKKLLQLLGMPFRKQSSQTNSDQKAA